MKKFILLTGLVFMLFVACNKVPKKPAAEKESPEQKIETKKYHTQSGKTFLVEIDKSFGASLNKVTIVPQFFEASNENYNLGAIDPVEEIFLADLDKNGFEEIYVVTRSVGSGSYSTIYSMASNKDKSATPVYVPPVSDEQLSEGKLFSSFMGHNKFQLKDGVLYNEYPVYQQEDVNANPSGRKRRIEYRLKNGEAGWILEAYKSIE